MLIRMQSVSPCLQLLVLAPVFFGCRLNSGVSLGPLSTCSMTCKGRICSKPLSLVVKTHLKPVLCGQNNVTNQRFGNGFIAPIIALHTCRKHGKQLSIRTCLQAKHFGMISPNSTTIFLSSTLRRVTP